MKKIILPCIIIFIILTINNYSYAVSATVNVSAVRIRETASTNSKIITNIYKNDKVEILEEQGEWCKVKYGDNIGYAKTEFFTKKEQTNNTTDSKVENTTSSTNATDNSTTNETATQSTTNNTITPTEQIPENHENKPSNTEVVVGNMLTLQKSVKVRVIPSLTAGSKAEIPQSATVNVEAKMGNWYKISSNSVSGWATKTKIVSTQVSQTTPAVTPEQTQPSTTVPAPEPAPSPEPTTEPENPDTSITNVVPNEPVKEPEQTETQTSSTNKKAVVTVETARVRNKPSTNSTIIDVLDEDDVVTITGEEGEFYKITCEKIPLGYISKSLVKVKDVTSRGTLEERENTVSTEKNDALNKALTSVSTNGSEIVEFAKQYLEYPYVLGCSTPETGFDCSGFTRYVYGHFGYKLGQVAAQQTSLGDVVERENLQTGDLLLFYDDAKTKIGHCGIYIDGGEFIHSANPKRGVVIDNLNTNTYYNQRFVTARRIK